MLRTAMNGPKSRAPPQWRVIVTRITQYCWTEIDPGVDLREDEHPLEAMLHWRDPVQRRRIIRYRRTSLLDDNPSSG